MNIYKILFLFLFITSFSIVNATDYTWTGDGATNSFNDPNNWGGTGLPATNSDNILFNNVGDINITNMEFINTLGNITISNNSNITFTSNGSATGFYIEANNIDIDINSSLTIDETIENIIKFDSGDIYGSVILENMNHKFGLSPSSTNQIVFHENSFFIYDYDNTSVDSPFNTGSIDNNIIFNNNSNYYHYSGPSPFEGGDFVEFQQGSNYYILGGNGSNIIFNGKNYGNIFIGDDDNPVDANVLYNAASTSNDFVFTELKTQNGSLSYQGEESDNIIIKSGLDAFSGNIYFECGEFSFENHTEIKSSVGINVSFKLLNTTTKTITIAQSGKTLMLNGDLFINSSVIQNTFLVHGNITCYNNHSIELINNDDSFRMMNNSKLSTENNLGINGSIISGIFTYDNNTTFEFIGNEEQTFNIGITSTAIGKVIIENSFGVKMDHDLAIDSLFINNGNFKIESSTLTIKKNIEYFNGKLFGSINSNLSLTDEVKEFFLNQDLTLNNLLINGINANIILEDGILTAINNITLNNGTLDLNNNELRVNANLNLNAGELFINNGNLIINDIINFSGGNIVGDQNAKLTFLSNAKEITSLPSLELSEFYLEAPVQITMGGDLIIYDLMSLNSGSLLISEVGSNYELKLLGDFQSGGGVLKGTNWSNLVIEGTSGADLSLVFSDTNNTLNNLLINRPSSIIDFPSDIIIEDNLDLSDGKIRLSNSTLFLADNSTVSNFSENSYIITGDNGLVKKVINASENFEFPIGTNQYYAPVSITPQNTETFNLKVKDNVLQNGYTGSSITDQRIVNLTWNIEHPDNTIIYDSDFSWETEAAGSEFTQSDSYLANYNTSTNKWEKITVSNTDVSNINNLFASDINVQGLFSISSIFNNPPFAENQEFTIPEHTLVGTVVGNLIASDPDVGQTLTFYVQENTINPDAFIFHENGTINVKSPELLEYSLHPTYNYTVDVCDNGEPEIQCYQFDVTINLSEIIQDFFVTNYISPNGDGKNDTWVIRGLEKGTYSVAVIDGKGNVVFRSDDYNNNWNGTKFGNKLPPGVYYYSITSENNSQKGTITLIR